MLAPESVPSPRPERCPRDVPLVLTARHGPGCSKRARACLLASEPFRVKRSPLGDALEELCWYQKSSERAQQREWPKKRARERDGVDQRGEQLSCMFCSWSHPVFELFCPVFSSPAPNSPPNLRKSQQGSGSRFLAPLTCRAPSLHLPCCMVADVVRYMITAPTWACTFLAKTYAEQTPAWKKVPDSSNAGIEHGPTKGRATEANNKNNYKSPEGSYVSLCRSPELRQRTAWSPFN